MLPYFYIIQHISSGKQYAGCKYSKDSNPDNFMKLDGYTTSSRIVNKIIEEEGINAFKVISIILESELQGESVYDYETRFLRENNISSNNNWLNMSNNNTWCELTPEKIELINQKAKETSIEKWGYEYASQSPEFREAVKNTVEERYGVNNISDAEHVKQKKIKTCQKNFGVDFPMQSKEVRTKSVKTCLEKYGVPIISQADHIKEKYKQTSLEKYGETHHNKTEEKRKILSERIKGKNNPRYGKPGTFLGKTHSEDTKRSNAMSKDPRRYFTPWGTFECFYDLKIFCLKNNLNPASVKDYARRDPESKIRIDGLKRLGLEPTTENKVKDFGFGCELRD